MEFRRFSHEDYDAVCLFLIELSRADKGHINWNWARFEWMYEHPEFDKSLTGSIGLWLDAGRIVGAAIYDMYFGEALCAVLPGYEGLYPDVLDYAYGELKDESGLGIAINDGSAREIAAARAAGFVKAEQTETIMRLELEKVTAAKLPDGLHIEEPDPVADSARLQWLFWQGFDHGEDYDEFLRQDQPAAGVRRNFNPHLGLAAVDAAGDYAGLCCLWYRPETDYAYVEPVCTVPAWRGRGVARALLTESMTRARALGAKDAFVISDMAFYEKLGFEKTQHYTFYWKK